MTKDMISKIESGKSAGSLKSLQSVEAALDRADIAFLDNDGVTRKAGGVKTFSGRLGFLDFIMDVYETVKGGGEIFVSNVDEDDFLKWEGDEAEAHMARMASIANLRFRILIQEGDVNTISSYAKYRWTPRESFSNIPFYIYGDKTALIVFEEDNVNVFVIRHPAITGYFRLRFLESWKNAKDVT